MSSPEGSDSPALQYAREERSRRVTDSSDGSPRKSVGDIHVTIPQVEVDYKNGRERLRQAGKRTGVAIYLGSGETKDRKRLAPS